MNHLWLIIAIALTVYLVRVGGFYLVRITLPLTLQQLLQQMPVAVFAALLAVSLPGHAGEGDLRLLATLGAGLALWWTKRLWVGLVVGLALFWLLRSMRSV